jgi:hypothetical protein
MNVESCYQCGAEMDEKVDDSGSIYLSCPVCGSGRQVDDDPYEEEEKLDE